MINPKRKSFLCSGSGSLDEARWSRSKSWTGLSPAGLPFTERSPAIPTAESTDSHHKTLDARCRLTFTRSVKQCRVPTWCGNIAFERPACWQLSAAAHSNIFRPCYVDACLMADSRRIMGLCYVCVLPSFHGQDLGPAVAGPPCPRPCALLGDPPK